MSIHLSSTTANLSMMTTSSSNKITEEQKASIESILSEYNSAELNELDASSIVQKISELGVMPGIQLEGVLADAGFDAKEIGDLASVNKQGPKGGPPPVSNDNATTINQENLQVLQDILAQYNDLLNLSSREEDSLIAQLSEAGLLEPGAIINITS